MHDGSSIEEYIKTAPESLKQLINNCNGRYLAFDNRARGTERDKQVKNLLAMIDEILIANDGNWYTISMYEEAERVMNLREEEIKKQREKELDMRDEVIKKLQEEINNRPSLRDEARPTIMLEVFKSVMPHVPALLDSVTRIALICSGKQKQESP
uniref:GTPase IMAP family member 4 n=1 Tax=Magallana gigas TaxID=29159 RepID=K1Q547_MAGGI